MTFARDYINILISTLEFNDNCQKLSAVGAKVASVIGSGKRCSGARATLYKEYIFFQKKYRWQYGPSRHSAP